MDKEVIEHIFEPFFTTKETGKGTGLGLAVVHGIVNNHNGFIYCESEPNKGTTFRILFPASTSEKVQQKAVEKPQYTPYGTERILLVDDEKNILEIGKETLKMFGYDVLIAENGEQALDIYRAQKDKINLVILDLIMPGKGGKKCLIDLRVMNPNVKVLMTSGYSSSEQTEELARVGATDFINKPYRPEDLLLTIRKILADPNHPDNDFMPLHSNKGV